jgi:catechol 2,3-dioxygenase-like lactoylglutathione lyase family enzyme
MRAFGVRTIGKGVIVVFAIIGVVLSIRELAGQTPAPLAGFTVNHIGIIVSDIDKTIALYEEAFGIKIPPPQVASPLSVPPGTPNAANSKSRFVQFKVGDTAFELLQPISGPGPHDDHLRRFGQGLQHIAIKVDDPAGAIKYLLSKGGTRTLRGYVDSKEQLGFSAEIAGAPPY